MSRPLQSIIMAYSTCNQNNLRMSQSYLWREIQDLLLISKNLRQHSVNHKMRMGSTVWPNNSSISKTRNSTVLFVKLTFRYAVQFLAVIKSKDVAVSFSLVKVSEYWKCTLHLWKRIFLLSPGRNSNSWPLSDQSLRRSNRRATEKLARNLVRDSEFCFLYSPSWRHTKISSLIFIYRPLI